VLTLYCSHTITTCLHTLLALTVLPTRTSCRLYQAPWKLACVRWEHACLAAQIRLLGFSLCLRPAAHKEPLDTWQRRSPPLLGGNVRSHRTRGSAGAHLSREARSGVIGHMAVLEPTSAERRGLEPQETWQCRSSPQLGGDVQSRMARGSVWMRALQLVLT
jgi:hypothetical protein